MAGVNLQLNLHGLTSGQVTSPDGLCKTFDGSANGYGRAEACGAMVLEACAAEGGVADDNDGRGGVRPGEGYASVLATAVNQDGKSASFMAPNGPSQEALLRDAMAEAGLGWAGQPVSMVPG